MLICIFKQVITTYIELEPGALSKPHSHHHDLKMLELCGESFLSSLKGALTCVRSSIWGWGLGLGRVDWSQKEW